MFNHLKQISVIQLKWWVFAVILLLSLRLPAQQVIDSTHILISASTNYQKSESYQRKWGRHYRKEWETPVRVKIAMLDTLAGGLTPYQLGGGRQSTSLRLKDAQNREYIIRSIDKDFGNALPEIARETFIETFINDQASIGHPFSFLAVAPLAEAAGILHTWPQVYYIPKQTRLGEYNDTIGDKLYLFEQRPDENWETADNFSNSENIVGTERMREKILKDNDNIVDQELYIRSRLFDMFIGDWSRHEDQWRWAEVEKNDKTIYKPVPRDRDMAFTLFDGTYLKRLIRIAGTTHLQTFDEKIKDLKNYNFTARYLDHHFTNRLTKRQWVDIAEDLRRRLTDKVIEDAVHQLPPELYPISGPAIIQKLKSRREFLPRWAAEYYLQQAREVDIRGSEKNELFDIVWARDSVTISMHKIDKNGAVETPYYTRTFYPDETKEIRVYGIDGNDKYIIKGDSRNKTKVILLGGRSRDEYLDSLTAYSKKATIIYDNPKNNFDIKHARIRITDDTVSHLFEYEAARYTVKVLKPLLFYSQDDRFFAGAAFLFQKFGWRKDPYAQRQSIDVKYSITQQAFSTTYQGHFVQAVSKWDARVLVNYDWVRWTNYFGLGNETILETKDRDFNRIRAKEFIARISFIRNFHQHHSVTLTPFYQTIDILRDPSRFIAKLPLPDDTYTLKKYWGAELQYDYTRVNESIIPTKGIVLRVNGAFINNSGQPFSFSRLKADGRIYFPISGKFSFLVKTGGSTLTGQPEFFNYNSLGGSETLRGFQRDRFYGNHTFFNQNELRWVKDVRSYLYNGKFGIYAFLDNGRVWLKDETSTTWHFGYGGGVLIAPFNKATISLSYGFSKEDSNIQFNIIRVF